MQLKRIIPAMAMLLATAHAWAEVAVIVNPKNPVNKMTADDASQYFLGKSTQLTPCDYPQGTALRGDFYSKGLEKEPAQVKAIWTKLLFTGKGVAPREYASVAEMKKAVSANVNAIGYIDKAAVDDSVKVVLTLP